MQSKEHSVMPCLINLAILQACAEERKFSDVSHLVGYLKGPIKQTKYNEVLSILIACAVESKLELSNERFSDCDEGIRFAPLSENVIY
jgi:hypothetical protein